MQHHVAMDVDAVELEHVFCRISPERGNLCQSGPLYTSDDGCCYDQHALHLVGCTVGWVHTINSVSLDLLIQGIL